MKRLSFMVVAGVLSSCSSAPVVQMADITKLDNGDAIAGVPFRIKTEHVVELWQLQDDGTYVQVMVTRQMYADMTRLFAIDVKTDVFASPSLKIGMNPDNTLKSMNVASSNNTSGGLDAINSVVTGINKSKSDKVAANTSALAAIATAEKQVRDAQAALDGLTSPTAETRAAYERFVEAAKRVANDAYAAAGLPKAYP